MLSPHTAFTGQSARAAGHKVDTQSPSARGSLWSFLKRLSLWSNLEGTVFYHRATPAPIQKLKGEPTYPRLFHHRVGIATL